jgi:hypothetical protein
VPKGVSELLSAATLRKPATVSALSVLYADPEMTSAAVRSVLARLKVSDVERLIPVLRVGAGTVAEAEGFTRFLRHDDSTVRLLAATACAERGDPAGLEVLVELLDDETADTSGRSPAPVWANASLALARLTGRVLGPPLDADSYTRRRALGAWRKELTERAPRWSAGRREWD